MYQTARVSLQVKTCVLETDEIFGNMAASELKGLSCSILKVKFKHEVNNLIFKCEMFNLKQNTQANPLSKHHLAPFNLKLALPKVMEQYSCRIRMNEVSIFTVKL